MLSHKVIARIKADFPRIARLSSRSYAVGRLFANRRVVREAPWASFSGVFLNAVNGQRIEATSVIEMLDKGHIVVAKDLLRETGLFNLANQIFESEYGLRLEDLGQIHDHLSVDQILNVTEKLKTDDRILQLECGILRSIFGGSSHLFAELMPNLRPHIPYNMLRGREQEIERRVGPGKMNAHGPHKDSWRYHPSNTLNVWLALSEVTPLNGMMVVPHTADYSPCFSDNEIVPGCDTYPDRQYLTSMNTGDVLLFRAELLHGSVLNQTDRTRFALSMRCTTVAPDFHRDFMYNYVRLLPSFSNLNRQKIVSRSSFVPEARDTFHAHFGPQERKLREISSESGDDLVVTFDGDTKRFCARCPHQGAPLSDGYLENGQIVCPQHQLRISPK